MEKYFMAAMGGAYGFGNKSIKRVADFFGSAQTAWFAEDGDLFKSGAGRKQLEAFIAFRREHPNAPEKLIGYCQRHKINLCSINDADYPPILKEITDPPMFFYYRGQLAPYTQRIGIVGTRDNTRYGKEVALELAEQLAAAGLTVVSGAARGIDTLAHTGAMRYGRTVAVLGCGINIAPSREKQKLLEQIAENGVVLSEFPPQMRPNEGTFPARNRIIAGLSLGVIVVEAGKKSGALISASYAGDYGRTVFVIPGTIYFEKSIGCHELIRDGATLIKNAQDVLDELNITAPLELTAEVTAKPKAQPLQVKPIQLSVTAAKVLEVIPLKNFITDDEILMQVDDLDPGELSKVMIELDLKGCVEEDAGRYKRKV